jgi:hypothetical protein
MIVGFRPTLQRYREGSMDTPLRHDAYKLRQTTIDYSAMILRTVWHADAIHVREPWHVNDLISTARLNGLLIYERNQV